jgi:multicomponent Na+:H+ antiporter subunit A
LANTGAEVPRVYGGPAGWISVLIPADWVPSLGIALSFLFDGLSLTFALLISGIGTLVCSIPTPIWQGIRNSRGSRCS